jgi:DNA-directed RNA polymerase specialized sigma24 family protein
MPPGYGRPVTTSPRDQARLNDALDHLTDALQAHLAACLESTGEADAVVQEAYTALRDAASSYDDLLFTLLDEVTPWEFAEAPPMAAEDEPRDGRLETIALLLRRDYTVADEGALLTAARQAYVELNPDDAESAVVEAVDHAGRALYQLLLAYGVDGLDQRAELAGLVRHGGTLWMQVIDEDDVATLADDPFGVADERVLVYRLDEVRADETD